MLSTLPEMHKVRMTYTKNIVDLFARQERKKQQLLIDVIFVSECRCWRRVSLVG